MFKDKNAKVREAISWVMSRVCEHHADVLSNPQIINHFMFCLLEAVKDRPRISNQCCSAIMKLASSLEPSTQQEQRANALTPFYADTMQVLLANTERDDF